MKYLRVCALWFCASSCVSSGVGHVDAATQTSRISLDMTQCQPLFPTAASLEHQSPEVLKIISNAKAHQHELCRWIYPLISSYLPNNFWKLKIIEFTVGSKSNDRNRFQRTLPVDITDTRWGGRTDYLFSGVVEILTRDALSQHITKSGALVGEVQERLMIDGMALYLAGQGHPIGKQDDLYRAFGQFRTVLPYFVKLDQAFREEKSHDPLTRNHVWLELEHSTQPILPICGAFIAKTLEAALGRPAFVKIIQAGPQKYWDQFQSINGMVMYYFPPPKGTIRENDKPLLGRVAARRPPWIPEPI